MTKKTVGYVDLEWTCPRCGNRNLGVNKKCSSCGAAQPQDVQFEVGAASSTLIEDEAKIQQAKSGPDIHCPYCGARNLAGAKACAACGADLATGIPRASGAVAGALQTGPVAMLSCPACGTPNPANALVCAKCGTSLKSSPVETKPPIALPGSLPKWLPFAFIGLVLLCIVLAIILTRTTDQVGTVTAVAWQRSVPMLEERAVEHQDWKDEIPQNAAIGTCEERKAGISDQPTDRSVKVCGTPYTVDKGNGYSEVIQDCQYEVYEDYCSYTIQEWTAVDTITASGTDLNPYWPQINLGSGQQAGDGSEQYKITFSTEQGDLNYTTPDASLFSAAEIGSRWSLKISSLGEILTIEPVP